MISTGNRDEKYGPPFVNSLNFFTPILILTVREARYKKQKNHSSLGSAPLEIEPKYYQYRY